MLRIPLLLLILAAPAFADARADLLAALDRERLGGDFAGALDLYRRASESPDAGIRTRARLGEARCLRCLGRMDEARTALEALLAAGPPPDLADEVRGELARMSRGEEPPPSGEELKANLARARDDLDKTREALHGAEGTNEELEREKQALEARVKDLAAKLAALHGGAEDGVARHREKERESARRAEFAAFAVAQARMRYREARIREARELVAKALEHDPANPEALALLARLGDAEGGRASFLQDVLRLLDEDGRLRREELRLRVDALLSAGEERLFAGEPSEAAARFAECIRLIDAHPGFSADLARRRAKAEDLLQGAKNRGGDPGPEPAVPAEPDPEARWRETFRALLADLASSSRPGGDLLRVHRLPLPPAPSRPERPPAAGLTAAGTPPDPGPLLARLLPAIVRPMAWRDGFVRDLGGALAVYGPAEVQEGVAELFDRIRVGRDPAVQVTVSVYAASPAAIADATRQAGAAFQPADDAAWVALTRAKREKLVSILRPHAEVLGAWVGSLAPGVPLSLASERSANLLVPPSATGRTAFRAREFGLTIDLLVAGGGEATGVVAAARTTRVDGTLTLPAARGAEIQVPAIGQNAAAIGARVPAGGSLTLAGLANPFASHPSTDRGTLLLVVDVRPTLDGAGPAPAADEPEPAAHPVDLHGLDVRPEDAPVPPFRGEASRANESRTAWLLRRIREAAVLHDAATTITLTRGVLWVRGGEGDATVVREIVDGLRAGVNRLVEIRLRAAALTVHKEAMLLAAIDGDDLLERGPHDVCVYRLSADKMRPVVYQISGAQGRIPLLTDTVVARSTQLVGLSRTTTLRYLSGYESDGSGASWPAYGEVDEGFSVSVRPELGADDDGPLVTLSAGARVARILDRGAASTPSEGAAPERPVQTVTSGRARASLRPGDGLLIAGLPAPTPVEGRRDQLVLLLEVLPK